MTKLKKAVQKLLHISISVLSLLSSSGDPKDEMACVPPPYALTLGQDSGYFFGTVSGAQGRIYAGKPMSKDGHILVIGGSGQGKTQGIVIPTMKTWIGSKIILDCKGDLQLHYDELYQGTGNTVNLFAPGTPEISCRYDPYELLREGGEDNLAGNIGDLARILLPAPPHTADPIWHESAVALLTGAILYAIHLDQSFIDTISWVVNTEILEVLSTILESDDTEAKLFVKELGSVPKKVIRNIGMELSSLVPLIANSAMRNAFSPDDTHQTLSWGKLNSLTEPLDTLLLIPEADLAQWEPMLRIMIEQLIRTLERRPARTYKEDELPPLLILLDEFARLGRVPSIKNGLTTLRSRGVTMSLIIQSLASLNELYGDAVSRVILDNCSYKVILGAGDVESCRYFSELVGTASTMQASIGVNFQSKVKEVTSYSMQSHMERRPIIYPQEFMTMQNVVFTTPSGVYRAEKTLFAQNQKLFLLRGDML